MSEQCKTPDKIAVKRRKGYFGCGLGLLAGSAVVIGSLWLESNFHPYSNISASMGRIGSGESTASQELIRSALNSYYKVTTGNTVDNFIHERLQNILEDLYPIPTLAKKYENLKYQGDLRVIIPDNYVTYDKEQITKLEDDISQSQKFIKETYGDFTNWSKNMTVFLLDNHPYYKEKTDRPTYVPLLSSLTSNFYLQINPEQSQLLAPFIPDIKNELKPFTTTALLLIPPSFWKDSSVSQPLTVVHETVHMYQNPQLSRSWAEGEASGIASLYSIKHDSSLKSDDAKIANKLKELQQKKLLFQIFIEKFQMENNRLPFYEEVPEEQLNNLYEAGAYAFLDLYQKDNDIFRSLRKLENNFYTIYQRYPTQKETVTLLKMSTGVDIDTWLSNNSVLSIPNARSK